MTKDSGFAGTLGEKETTAEAFLFLAEEYRLAASTLLPHQNVESPRYFLYAHAIELAFKAYLRSHGIPTLQLKGHDLKKLLKSCFGEGLQAHSDLEAVIGHLQSENEEHGFRDFLFNGTSRPEIQWLRTVADGLLDVVADEVKKRPVGASDAKAVFKFAVWKPGKK